MSRELLDAYAAGAEKVSLAIRGLTPADMSCATGDAKLGRWTIQQLVAHLADAELAFSERMKRIITEENPTIFAYDEDVWVKALHYEVQDPQVNANLVESMRKQMTAVLKALPQDAMSRFGTHSQRGRVTLKQFVEYATSHLEHHLKFLHAKRAAMGKEMW
jgi:hypothetical protein